MVEARRLTTATSGIAYDPHVPRESRYAANEQV